jgi:hypothetical protein
MSERNGDKARFQKDRKRKLHRRQRIRELSATLRPRTNHRTSSPDQRGTGSDAASRAASAAMQDEGGPTRAGD